jgi:hypothetical protein
MFDTLRSGGRLRGGVFDEDLWIDGLRLLGLSREEGGMRDERHLQRRRREPILDRGEEQSGSGGKDEETSMEAMFH